MHYCRACKDTPARYPFCQTSPRYVLDVDNIGLFAAGKTLNQMRLLPCKVGVCDDKMMCAQGITLCTTQGFCLVRYSHWDLQIIIDLKNYYINYSFKYNRL